MAAIADNLLNFLHEHSMIKSVRVVNYDETPFGKVELKIRCRLSKNYQLQIWLHHEPTFQDYAYQLFTDHPILRWDNAPHYPHVLTSPHHFHDETGTVRDPPLSGRPLEDLKMVLVEIEKWLSKP